MAQKACEKCGRSFNESVLLYHEAGRICAECETTLDEERAEAGRIQSLIVGGPLLAFASMMGVVGGLIPVLGLIFLVATPFLAVIGLIQGLRALIASTREANLSSGQKTGLVVSGALSTLWCLAVIPVSTIMLIGVLLAMATQL